MEDQANRATVTPKNTGPSGPKAEAKSAPASCSTGAENAIRPVSRSTRPAVRMARAVRVHTTKVDTNTWNIPHIPCCTGSGVEAEPLAMAEEPSPASLEKHPRAKPQRTAVQTP